MKYFLRITVVPPFYYRTTEPEDDGGSRVKEYKVEMFSREESTILKVNVPLEQQETDAGLLPLSFKVYEYGTKPGEQPTTVTQEETSEGTTVTPRETPQGTRVTPGETQEGMVNDNGNLLPAGENTDGLDLSTIKPTTQQSDVPDQSEMAEQGSDIGTTDYNVGLLIDTQDDTDLVVEVEEANIYSTPLGQSTSNPNHLDIDIGPDIIIAGHPDDHTVQDDVEPPSTETIQSLGITNSNRQEGTTIQSNLAMEDNITISTEDPDMIENTDTPTSVMGKVLTEDPTINENTDTPDNKVSLEDPTVNKNTDTPISVLGEESKVLTDDPTIKESNDTSVNKISTEDPSIKEHDDSKVSTKDPIIKEHTDTLIT